ncbi:acetyl-CoA carboxylase, biotin carboxyl carrier protein [Desulfurispirillum indicum S5]|uniref:Biotin carboxyl carrier protein of acetyl-CoA carboxylase n=1 Tax=Desulfurispirillum indicum (strain ATCC BAA-1389 / DSM 22839 / S5) TaxID=653733 RepID=E6W7E4_DESIS|nr:acetyl-CoA carboxylase biotin carboxyl carrier protein [Desulfurispirillum indicum]ADU66311.1 acetyl-CoA carboxylase, biotin carboxyl carrier protein [Desulfurispirillum indicum S5]
MDIKDIQALVAQVDSSSVNELCIEQDSFKLQIRKLAPNVTVAAAPVQVAAPVAAAPAPAPASAAPVSAADAPSHNYAELKSPIVGTFYSAPSPDSPPYARPGEKVKKGQVLCIVEAMKIMNEIESEFSGTIVKVLVENGKPVEFGQTLFLIEEE